MTDKVLNITKKMRNLVGFRGTIKELEVEIASYTPLRSTVILEPFEEYLPELDLGFNTNLGELDGEYYDFEVYLLPTFKADTFVVTEVSAF